jgi:hypothetical protein
MEAEALTACAAVKTPPVRKNQRYAQRLFPAIRYAHKGLIVPLSQCTAAYIRAKCRSPPVAVLVQIRQDKARRQLTAELLLQRMAEPYPYGFGI